jgi:hypothetical protein
MRKLFVLPLIFAFGPCFRFQGRAGDVGAPGNIALPASIAWKEVVWAGEDPNPVVSINLVDKDRWRLEARNASKPRILVAVFDGSQLAASNPKAPTTLDPRQSIGPVLSELARGRVVGIEQRDGHSCWHFSIRLPGLVEDVWVDTQTRFPVYLEGTAPDGQHVRGRYSLLNIDLVGDAARYFSAGSTTPLFEASLNP